MEKMFNCVLLLLILITIHHLLQHYKNKNNNVKVVKKTKKIEIQENKEKFITVPEVKSDTIKFNYNKEIEKQFQKEQEKGFLVKSFVPNNADENKKDEEFVDTKTMFNYEFIKPKIEVMNGIMKPEDVNKTIKEIYDNSFVDFKKLVPKKNKIENNDNVSLNAASNLTFFTNDNWLYDNEKPENGGQIKTGLYANDLELLNSNAIY